MGRLEEIEGFRRDREAIDCIITLFLDQAPQTGISLEEIARRGELGKWGAQGVLNRLLFERVVRPGVGHDHYYLNEKNPLVQFIRLQQKRPRGRRRR